MDNKRQTRIPLLGRLIAHSRLILLLVALLFPSAARAEDAFDALQRAAHEFIGGKRRVEARQAGSIALSRVKVYGTRGRGMVEVETTAPTSVVQGHDSVTVRVPGRNKNSEVSVTARRHRNGGTSVKMNIVQPLSKRGTRDIHLRTFGDPEETVMQGDRLMRRNLNGPATEGLLKASKFRVDPRFPNTARRVLKKLHAAARDSLGKTPGGREALKLLKRASDPRPGTRAAQRTRAPRARPPHRDRRVLRPRSPIQR